MSEVITVNDAEQTVSQPLSAIANLIENEEFAKAIEQSEKIDKSTLSDSDIVLLYHYQGVALFRERRSSEALLKLKKSLDTAEAAHDVAGQARAHEEIGGVLHHESRLQDAKARYDRALQLFERLDDKDGIGRGHRNLGNLAVDMNDASEALKEYDISREVFRALGKPLEMAPAIIHKASVLYQQQGIASAVEAYRVGIEEDKCEHYLIHNNYGFLLMLQGQLEKGLTHLESALKAIGSVSGVEDDLALIYLNMGVAYALQKDLARGEDYLRKAGDLLEHFPEARAVEFLLQANEKYQDKDFHPYLVVDNGQKKSLAHLNLGTVLAWAGRLDEARAEVDKGIELDRTAGYPYLSAGWIYLAQGDEKAATIAFHRACGTEPGNVEFTKAQNLVNPYLNSKVGRNEPCPCGSGKKFKKCHGVA